MALEIRKNSFSKSYENEFFRLLAIRLGALFEQKNWDGILIGSPVCTVFENLQIDVLLVTKNSIVIIDLKNFRGEIVIPKFKDGYPNKKTDPWLKETWWNGKVQVKGGSHVNPFTQLEWQTKKLSEILRNDIIPKLRVEENIEVRDLKRVLCFQGNIHLNGEIDPRFKHNFFICDPTNIVNTIIDIHDVKANEWNGNIKGIKIIDNTYRNFKDIFRADIYSVEQNGLISEFSDIVLPEKDLALEKFISTEFLKFSNEFDALFKGDLEVLVMLGSHASHLHSFIPLISSYAGENGVENIEFFAPTRRDVKYLNTICEDIGFTSLYSRLFNYSDSQLELTDNNEVEREVFPLIENSDQENTLYIISCGQLIFDFESNEKDLLRFGSGSLLRDIFNFVQTKTKNNKVIFLADPYWFCNEYGFGKNVLNEDLVHELGIKHQYLRLSNLAVTPNDVSCVEIANNLDNKIFNQLSISENENVIIRVEDEFKSEILDQAVTMSESNSKILARDKMEARDINQFIRKSKGVVTSEINLNDWVLFKNRARVAEIEDPFSVPKVVHSGDEGVVRKILSVHNLYSEKYKLVTIEIFKCVVWLPFYESERIVYILSKPKSQIEDSNLLRKHIRIRINELVRRYLENQKVSISDLLTSEKFKEYESKLNEIKSSGVLFTNNEIAIDPLEMDKKIKKLNAEFKINKLQENYARTSLLNDVDSEYYMLSQLAFVEFAWAQPIQPLFSNNFSKVFLPMKLVKSTNAELYFKYLYSGLALGNTIYLNSFKEINFFTQVQLDFDLEKMDESKDPIFFKFNPSFKCSKEIQFLANNYDINPESIELLELFSRIRKKINTNEEIVILRIEHLLWHEMYHFTLKDQVCRIKFNYQKDQASSYQAIEKNELADSILSLLNSEEQISQINFDDFRKTAYEFIQECLLSKGCYIFDIIEMQFKDLVKISDGNNKVGIDFTYNSKGFFTNIKLRFHTNKDLSYTVLGVLMENL
jgi:hypothetical protein